MGGNGGVSVGAVALGHSGGGVGCGGVGKPPDCHDVHKARQAG